KQLIGALRKVLSATGQLRNGLEAGANGSDQLVNGLEQAKNGTATLNQNVQAAAPGTQALANGLQNPNSQVGDALPNAGELNRRARELKNAVISAQRTLGPVADTQINQVASLQDDALRALSNSAVQSDPDVKTAIANLQQMGDLLNDP